MTLPVVVCRTRIGRCRHGFRPVRGSSLLEKPLGDRFNFGIRLPMRSQGGQDSGGEDKDHTRRHAPVGRLSLDLARGVLVRDGVAIHLRPKTLAVLAALVESRGAVIGRDELRRTVWGVIHGNDAGPKQCIRELRGLFRDPASGPRLIETVGRRGYRLLVVIDLVGAEAVAPGQTVICVGRTNELNVLAEARAAAARGSRLMLMVSGEPGAGKTRLADSFVACLPKTAAHWTARGQCVPHPGAREPYGPLLEILGQLVAGRFGATV
jgi:DNA-binding winged helix-turn-helix (wHTH) protein